METLIPIGILALAIYVVIRLMIRSLALLTGSKYRAYRRLASEYGGKYESRGFSEAPTISFPHEGSFVRVGLAPNVPGQSSKPRTRVVARFARGLPFRLELAPIGRPRPSQPPKGTRPVRIGDAPFDRAYTTQANDAEIARDFLELRAREAIEALRRLAPPAGLLVSINPERLLVQVDRDFAAHPEALLFAVGRALEIHDRLLAGVEARLAEGVDIVGVGPAEADEAGPPICKVCGEPIDAPHVLCARCKTPHHGDCWSFVGGCSIYGCNGKQSVSA